MTETTPSSKPRPPKQSRTGLKANGTRKAASKSNRSRAREFALQALYQHIVGRNDAAAIDSFTRDLPASPWSTNCFLRMAQAPRSETTTPCMPKMHRVS